MKTAYYIGLGTLLLLTLGAVAYMIFPNSSPSHTINSFQECVEAGYPILESYPEQCHTPDGQKFVREIKATPSPSDYATHILSKSNLITVTSPEARSEISSPLTITGQARGTWYFEASFPIRIEDANGNVLGISSAQAQGDWMTEDFVPFQATLTFSAPSTTTGTLILEKDNPSGLLEHADQLRIPMRFMPTSTQSPQQPVQLYYYNPRQDQDATGNALCSAAGLVAVSRNISATQTPIQDTIRLLLTGNITPEEKTQGLTTNFPLDGVRLMGATLNNGVLTLQFSDPNNTTSGGACRVNIMRAQIEQTAKQFSAVNEVHIHPKELFQP